MNKIWANRASGRWSGDSGPSLAWRSMGCALLLTTGASATAARSLADLSIEELMNESVTSVSQKEQKIGDVATAISVLSNEDIRRSGASSIPEALRLAPGLAVASFNASEWAISSRGFNSLYANKLLVMVDGRAVYTPLFAGVYWDLQQTMLEDVDRIEVIRGPGATIWGANAVNGVVSVVTRSAKDTQGSLLYGGGDSTEASVGARYGGQIGANTYYRAFASRQSIGSRSGFDGQPASGWRATHGGVRVDQYQLADTHLTWQADATDSRLDNETAEASNFNTLGRWTRRLSSRSGIEVQAYFDRTYRDESAGTRVTMDTSDLTLHHTFGVGEYHDVIWGIGYRHIDNALEETSPAARIRDRSFSLQLFTAFLQDEITLVPQTLSLTVGTKLERNDFTGIEIQPSVRAVYKPTTTQSFWTAISRAARTPDVVEGRDAVAIAYGLPISGPGGMLFTPTLVGDPGVSSETERAYEAGYRTQLSRRVNVDIAAYYNEYRQMISFGAVRRLIPGTPVGIAELPWTNNLRGNARGVEVAVKVSPMDAWRLTASYALFRARFHGPESAAPAAREGDTPRHQAMLRSSSDLSNRARLNVQVRYIDGVLGVSPYCTADVRLAYQLTEHIEFAAIGKNLLDRSHLEQPVALFDVVSEVPRTFGGKITWRF